MSLISVYHATRKIPGWLSLLQESGVFTGEEIMQLEQEDTDQIYGMEKNVYRGIENAFKDIRHDYEYRVSNLETDEEKIGALSKFIAEQWESLVEKMKRFPFWLIDIEAKEIKNIERYRSKIQARMVHKDHPDSRSLTEWEIHRARTYPLENLVSVGRNGRIICEWHEDTRPSMMVKNGWGYCHACGKSVDSIRWMQEVKGMSFKDAVKYLSGRM